MNEVREDGPALQKLFTAIEPKGYHEQVPPEMDQLAKQREAMVDLGEGAYDVHVSDQPADDDTEDNELSPMTFARLLSTSGDTAIQILKEMCDAEMAMGNPKNMPEPVLGWYALTLTYQLGALEACNGPQRPAHAAQLAAAIAGMRAYRTPYANGVIDEIDLILSERVPMMQRLIPGQDLTYGGVLSWA